MFCLTVKNDYWWQFADALDQTFRWLILELHGDRSEAEIGHFARLGAPEPVLLVLIRQTNEAVDFILEGDPVAGLALVHEELGEGVDGLADVEVR